MLIQGLSIFSVLTLLLAGFAVHQSALAKEQKEESLARYLASKSEDLGENSMTLDTSALLAIESFRLHRTADADRLIHNILPLRCCVASLKHFNDINSFTFSPNGRYIATAGDTPREITKGVDNVTSSEIVSLKNTVRIWDATTGKIIFQKQCKDCVSSLTFSPDEKYILALVDNDAARLLDVSTGDDIFDLGLDYNVHHTAFSPGGKYIVTAGDGFGTAEVWMYKTDDIINKIGTVLTRNLTPEEWKRYMGDEPYHKTFPDLP